MSLRCVESESTPSSRGLFHVKHREPHQGSGFAPHAFDGASRPTRPLQPAAVRLSSRHDPCLTATCQSVPSHREAADDGHGLDHHPLGLKTARMPAAPRRGAGCSSRPRRTMSLDAPARDARVFALRSPSSPPAHVHVHVHRSSLVASRRCRRHRRLGAPPPAHPVQRTETTACRQPWSQGTH